MRDRLRSLPIRTKVVLATVLASLVALVVTAAGMLIYEAGSFRPKEVATNLAHHELLAPVLAPALRFRDPAAAEQDLRVLAYDDSVCQAVVFDRDGDVFAELDEARHPDHRPSGPEPFGVRLGPRVVRTAGEIADSADELGSLVIVRDLPPFLLRLPQYGLMLFVVIFALLASSALLMLAMRRTITGPVLALADAAEKVRDREDFSVRAPPASSDEIGRLTDAFNEMLDRIQRRDADLAAAAAEQRRLQADLEEAARLESVGRLAGGVAHDFNNLLTIIGGSTDLALLQAGDPEAVRKLLTNVRRATTQASDLTGRLLAFARRQPLELRPVELRRLLLDTEGMVRSILGSSILLELAPGDAACWVRTDQNQLSQVLVNLVLNARDAMPAGGHLEISLGRRREAPAEAGPAQTAEHPLGFGVVTVRDDGHGMSEETRKRVFEPFFTTKEAGRGTGLGLASSYGIVRDSGGFLQVESRPGEGSTFVIWLPCCSLPTEAPTRSEDPEPRPARECGGVTVLLAEDDDLVRSTTAETLRGAGYRVLEANGGARALALAADHPGGIDLLVTDVVMPRMSGVELALRLRDLDPDLQVLFVSGHSTEAPPSDTEDWADFLAKPYRRTELLTAVRGVAERARAARET